MDYIKICGLKKIEDVNICIENGATAVGFIYNVRNSPRNLEKSKLLALLKEIHEDIFTVITFRANNTAEVYNNMQEIKANYYQVHCNFNIRDLDKFSSVLKKKLIIALKVDQSNKEGIIKQINLSFDQFFAFLIDNSEGSGRDLDYKLILDIRRRTAGTKIIIAGGINIDNIEPLIKSLHPYGIDVSSSLEFRRGVKDPIKIKQFLEKVKNITN